MAAKFSWETQELLDRADRAIERSIKVREETARAIAKAQEWISEVNMYRDRTAPPFRR